MITGYGDPPHGCLRAFGKTGQEKLTGRRRVYATSTVYANAGYNPIIPCWPGGRLPGTPRWLKAPFLRHGALAPGVLVSHVDGGGPGGRGPWTGPGAVIRWKPIARTARCRTPRRPTGTTGCRGDR
jgi:hypothetical protein